MPVDEDLDRAEDADLHEPPSRNDVVSPKSADCGPRCNVGTTNSRAAAARRCGLALIAQLKAAIGNLDRVTRVVKLTGFVNSTPDFTDQPKVINGCSDLMVEVFGEAGRHSRAAVSAPSLPFGVAVEVEAVFEIA